MNVRYIGTTIVNAVPMTRLDYNNFRGWTVPEDEDGADTGFLIEQVDETAANSLTYRGHQSWLPDAVFHKIYKPMDETIN